MTRIPPQVADAATGTYEAWLQYATALHAGDAPTVAASGASAFAGAGERIEALQAQVERNRANPVFPAEAGIPRVREVLACDLKPGMRLQRGAPWQSPVSSVKTWGPGEGEASSYPETWWTRVTVVEADGRHVGYYHQPSSPVRVVGEVACRDCAALVLVADAVTGRRFDRTVRPPRFVEQYDLCPACADTLNDPEGN
jgi:hypothetical protein